MQASTGGNFTSGAPKLLVLGATGGTGRGVVSQALARGYEALTDLSTFHGGTISRSAVARFVLGQVRDNTWLHQTPLITW
jgi:uncharacterized protein YbjT (DUF2867 family)